MATQDLKLKHHPPLFRISASTTVGGITRKISKHRQKGTIFHPSVFCWLNILIQSFILKCAVGGKLSENKARLEENSCADNGMTVSSATPNLAWERLASAAAANICRSSSRSPTPLSRLSWYHHVKCRRCLTLTSPTSVRPPCISRSCLTCPPPSLAFFSYSAILSPLHTIISPLIFPTTEKRTHTKAQDIWSAASLKPHSESFPGRQYSLGISCWVWYQLKGPFIMGVIFPFCSLGPLPIRDFNYESHQ